MYLHVHSTDGVDQYVAHLNREEAIALVKNLSGTLALNEEADAFSLNLGTVLPEVDEEYGAIKHVSAGGDDDERIAGE